MSTPAGVVGGLLGSAASNAAAFAAGIAIGPTLAPEVRFLVNEAWKLAPTHPLDPATAAAIAAESVDLYPTMEAEASFSGIDAGRFKDLWGVTLTAPGMGELLAMLRRGTINPGNFAHGLRKAKLEAMWDDALADLQHVRLSPQQLALGIVRSVVNDPGLLAVTLDTSGGVVPAYPQWAGDVLAEAKAGGIDSDRLRVMVGEIGLPMSAQQAASAYFRRIIELGDFNRAILEGDTRPEWAPSILEQARQIPTPHDGIEDHLRGWTDAAAMYAQAARHGMSKADTDLLFRITGRPLSFHQVFIGERRGGTFNGGTAAIDPAFLKSLQESNIRPEWYDLAWAQRHTLPSAFVLRALLTGGVITAAQGEGYFLDIGWPPALAKQVADFYGAGTAATGDKHLAKAQTQLWTTLHRSYLAGESTQAEVSAALPRAGVSAAVIPDVLATWDEERAIIRKQLSPAQVKKAYVEGVLNPDTGAAWTKDEATAALVARGYSTADATTFLEL